MPAPKANRNAIRHGLTSTRLPAGASYIKKAVAAFRRSLEDEILSRPGREIGIWEAALISSAVRHETRAQLLQRWLRIAGEPETRTEGTTTKSGDGTATESVRRNVGLGVMERASLLAQISAATDQRDKCLDRLGFSQDRRKDTIDAIYTVNDDEGTQRDVSVTDQTVEASNAE